MSDSRPNDSVNPENAETFNPSMQAPGAQLAALREARGWTVEQVASQLNLAPRQVRAIESDDYPALPGMAITRGFMRSYAKLLQVDPGSLLASISGETVIVNEPATIRKAVPTTFSESHLPLRSDNRGSKTKKLGAVLIAAALGIGAWAVWHQGGLGFLSGALSSDSGKQASPDATGKIEQSTDSANATANAADQSLRSDPAAEASAPAAAVGMTPQASIAAPAANTATIPQPAAAPDPVVVTPPAGSGSSGASAEESVSGTAKQADAAGKNALVLTIREDSWLEIRRANKLVTSRLAKAGETETVDMTGPVTLLLGNAHGVDATLRGKPVQIVANKNNNTARLTFE